MKNYYELILEKLLDMYEKREGFRKNAAGLKAVQIDPGKLCKEYIDRYDHTAYREMNAAIQKLEQQNIVTATLDSAGKYIKVKLNIGYIEAAYHSAGRIPVPKLCDCMRQVLAQYGNNSNKLIQTVIRDFVRALDDYKKLPYDINFDSKKLKTVLDTLCAIVSLQHETYTRNFSTAVFKDSKEFQKNMRSIVQGILYDFTDLVVEKERILEVYNLFENPTYVLIKGNLVLKYKSSVIDLTEMNGGIAIPNFALDDIIDISVRVKNVVTVENLTTYHDSKDDSSTFIYLGGFHNSSKQKFLKKLYRLNPDKNYYHKGDLDVYGFLILENLKNRTEIPFMPLEMDVDTLSRYYEKGLFKGLTASDKKAMNNENLQRYRDVLDFMLAHNCKVEQESMKALELLEGKF